MASNRRQKSGSGRWPTCFRHQRSLTDYTPGTLGAVELTERTHAVRGGAHTAGGTGVFGEVSSMRPPSCSTTREIHQRQKAPERDPSEAAR